MDNSKLPTAIDESMYVPMGKYRQMQATAEELAESIQGAANFMVGMTLDPVIPAYIKEVLNEKADALYELIEKYANSKG